MYRIFYCYDQYFYSGMILCSNEEIFDDVFNTPFFKCFWTIKQSLSRFSVKITIFDESLTNRVISSKMFRNSSSNQRKCLTPSNSQMFATIFKNVRHLYTKSTYFVVGYKWLVYRWNSIRCKFTSNYPWMKLQFSNVY